MILEKILKRILRTIERYRLIEPGEKVLVSVSGGPDSTFLLHALDEIKEELPHETAVAHFDHGLRGEESAEDREFVKRLGADRGHEVSLGEGDPATLSAEQGLSLEEASRILRYGFLHETAMEKGCTKIAVGHTLDDQAENFLLRLFRGAGSKGLASIKPIRPDGLIRPLLETEKEEILTYLAEHNIAFRRDSSNRDPRFSRNRLRTAIIPAVKASFHSTVQKNIALSASILRDENSFIEEIAREASRRSLILKDGTASMKTKDLLPLHTALRRRILREMIHHVKGDLRSIYFPHVELLLEALEEKKRRFRLDLPGNLEMILSGSELTARMKPAGQDPPEWERELDIPCRLALPRELGTIEADRLTPPPAEGELKRDKTVAFLDGDALSFPLKIRTRKRGDRFHQLGAAGEQKLHDFFINRKIPLEMRDKIPLVISDTCIAWVAGLEIAEAFKVTPTSKSAARLRWRRD